MQFVPQFKLLVQTDLKSVIKISKFANVRKVATDARELLLEVAKANLTNDAQSAVYRLVERNGAVD
jgi:hypothetical protein